jgi:hypothetical protein
MGEVSDTDYFRQALAEYQRKYNDPRGFADLPRNAQTWILARAQDLKDAGTKQNRRRRNIGGGLLSGWTREEIRRRDDARFREQQQSRKRVTGASKVRAFLDRQESKAGKPRQRGLSAERHDVMLALRDQGYSKSEARKKALSASGSGFEQLFRSAMSKGNPMATSWTSRRRELPPPDRGTFVWDIISPRGIPEFSVRSKQQADDILKDYRARDKRLRTKGNPTMATRKRKKKKRNGVMPPALKKYWAKLRGKKNSRPKRRRKKQNARRATVKNARRVRTFRSKPKTHKRRTRRTRNPMARVRQVTLPRGLTPTQTRKVVSLIRRVSKRRVRVQ